MYNYWEGRADTALCELLWLICLKCQSVTNLEMMQIFQAQLRCPSVVVLAHTQVRRIEKRNEKLVTHQKLTYIKQVVMGQFWNLAQKITWTSIVTFQSFFVSFPEIHDLEKVTSLSVWLGVRRTSGV